MNASAVQFAHADLPALVTDVIAQTGLLPERLEPELTESTIFVDRTITASFITARFDRLTEAPVVGYDRPREAP